MEPTNSVVDDIADLLGGEKETPVQVEPAQAEEEQKDLAQAEAVAEVSELDLMRQQIADLSKQLNEALVAKNEAMKSKNEMEIEASSYIGEEVDPSDVALTREGLNGILNQVKRDAILKAREIALLEIPELMQEAVVASVQ